MDWHTFSILVFIIIVVAIVYRDRKKFKRESVLLLRRTNRGKHALVAIGTRFPLFWKVVGMAGVFTGFYFSLSIMWTFLQLTYRNMIAETSVQGLAFVLPSPTTTAISGPGVFLVPFWYWIIAITLLVVVHEGMHGIMTARERVRIKSLGTGLLAVIPLAFVEPDEQKLAKKPLWAQLRVLAAGSFANFVLATISLLALIALVQGAYATQGIQYSSVMAGSPAEAVNLSGTITALNGQPIQSIPELVTVLDQTQPGEELVITTTENETTLTLANQPQASFVPSLEQGILLALGQEETVGNAVGSSDSWLGLQKKIGYWEYIATHYPGMRVEAKYHIASLQADQLEFKEPGYVGIIGAEPFVAVKKMYAGYAGWIAFLNGLLFFLFLLNFGVGAANLLPIKPLDGGRMWELVFYKLSKKHYRTITHTVGWLTLFILVVNFVLPFL